MQGRCMRQPSTRLLALAILVFLIAAQVHVWVEAVPARNAGHFCGVCAFGAWAIFSAAPGLTVTLLTLRLRSEEHTSELQSRLHLVCRLLLEKKKEINSIL